MIEVNADPGLHHHYNIVDPPGPTPVAERILERLLGASAAETPALIAAMDAAPRR